MLLNNKYSIIVALAIMYLSLTGSQTFPSVPFINIPFLDKIIHFGMYFFLMSVMIFENRKRFRNISRLFLLALFPLFYGIILEILQMTITKTRSGDLFDFLANAAGTITALLLWIWIRPMLKDFVR
jgi:VanZ family protein